MKLTDNVEVLKGVGPVILQGLHRAKIFTIADLLHYWPRRFEDYSTITQLKDIVPGRVAVHCNIETVNVRRSARNPRLTITEAILTDGTGTIKAVWFNQPFLATTFKTKKRFLFLGDFEFKNRYLSLNNPKFEPADEQNYKGKIFAIYPENKIITSKIIQKLIAQVIDLYTKLKDTLPESIEKDHKLMSYAQAVRQLHQPESMALLAAAKARVGFAELFELFATGIVIKSSLRTEETHNIPFELSVVKHLLSQIKFKLTNAQRQAAWQILQDMNSEQPMNRMLEGDVGSGKTLVALIAIATAAHHGLQSALIVPTEILARQHLQTFEGLLKPLGIHCSLLISALPKKAKDSTLSAIASGKTQVVIGTQALLSESVHFKSLGLVVVDEQHRFGVNQRRQLKTKAHVMPHVLTMTATPIPRSLALVVYGDLDVSVIAELPPGRKPVETKVVTETDRRTVEFFIDSQLSAGKQVFVVCPLIEEDEQGGRRSVKAEYDRLQKTIFAHRNIAMIHGRMSSDEKAKIMQDFKAKKYHILVSTTVIEVGVDIPNATILCVENAERFGLAALHQLRGRVGRAQIQSYCYVFTDSQNPTALERLKALQNCNDGFRLAEIDLQLRGPGELYGTSQHGLLDLSFADITDVKMLTRVKNSANTFIKAEKLVQYPELLAKINKLKKLTSLD